MSHDSTIDNRFITFVLLFFYFASLLRCINHRKKNTLNFFHLYFKLYTYSKNNRAIFKNYFFNKSETSCMDKSKTSYSNKVKLVVWMKVKPVFLDWSETICIDGVGYCFFFRKF